MKIGIVGRNKDTINYEKMLKTMKKNHITSLSVGELAACQALIFPGGGDITPELFGQKNLSSRNIDTELDLLQLRIFEQACRQEIPILGICKGMQIINVGLGGSLIQDLPTAHLHTSPQTDLYHESFTATDSFLYKLYGEHFVINSRHHQSVDKLGNQLIPVQWCPIDHCIEALTHENLPIFGVQWHPERLSMVETSICGNPLFAYFLSFA